MSEPVSVVVEWAGERRFDATRAGATVAPLRLDGSGETGLTPVGGLLSALAACAAVDVADILAKRRTPVDSLRVDVAGERVDTIPRRLRRVVLRFTISGSGIEQAHAERAAELSVTKYCSVRDSLREDIAVEWTVVLEPSRTPAGALDGGRE